MKEEGVDRRVGEAVLSAQGFEDSGSPAARVLLPEKGKISRAIYEGVLGKRAYSELVHAGANSKVQPDV